MVLYRVNLVFGPDEPPREPPVLLEIVSLVSLILSILFLDMFLIFLQERGKEGKGRIEG